MARHKRGASGLDAWADMIARLPWWVGLLLAVVSHVLLRQIAKAEPPPATELGQLSQLVSRQWVVGLAYLGQYLVPAVCLVGAALSWIQRRRARQLAHDATERSDGIAQMHWRDFETLVAEYFRRQSMTVTETGGGGPDGGVDVIARRGTDRYLVQCKHWRARRVGVEPVRELYGLIAAQRLAGGYVVTSGDFTEQARAFASGREIELINGRALQRGLRASAAPAIAPLGAAVVSPPVEPAFAHTAPLDTASNHAFASTLPMTSMPESEPSATPPACPVCGAAMVQRQARTGANAGHAFWGCSQFAKTRCSGTRPLKG